MTTQGVDIDSTSKVGLTERLETSALDACNRIRFLSAKNDVLASELQDKFLPAIMDVQSVKIAPLAASDGAFRVDGNLLIINEEPIARLLAVVNDEYRHRFAGLKHLPPSADLPELLARVFTDYVLHEVRHRAQGVGEYFRVKELKNIAGNSAMAWLDTLADRDAAYAYAAIYSDNSDRGNFLSCFREALFFSGNYYFKVFPVDGNRQEKLERTMAIVLMAARLASQNLADIVSERPDLRLDAPLRVQLSDNRRSLAIYRCEPSEKSIAVANDDPGVKRIIDQIVANDFDGMVGAATVVMKKYSIFG